MPLTLRLDPWPPGYEGAVQVEEEDTVTATVDAFVETSNWRPLGPEPCPRPETIAFVDGVQRTEMRLVGEDDGRMVFGALASIGVGAVIAREDGCSMTGAVVQRVLALADGGMHAVIGVPCGNMELEFQPRGTAATGPNGPQQAILDARREAETELGLSLEEQGHEMVVVDGRLNWQPKRDTDVIGLVKTIHRRYLEPAEASVIQQIGVGERTPIFRIERQTAVYSWYLRLSVQRPFDHPWAGVARVETLDTIGLESAVRLADLTACHLPSFASSPIHDPRAPQNLYPIGGLEQQLRHNLGDSEWIRRHIEMYFAREVAA